VNRVAVVTGGSSGIGSAISRALAARGWRCVLVARDEEKLRARAGELGAEYEVCDVADREAVDRLAARVTERHAAVQLLVNNAGVPGRKGFLDADPELIERVMRINYLGGVWCTRAFVPALERAAPSDVVHVASVAGTVVAGTSGVYTSSKHAQVAFARAVAAELRPRGIRSHLLMPGFVETEGFPQRGVWPEWMMPLIAQPEDVAKAVLRALDRDRREVTVPYYYRLGTISQWLFPGIVGRVAGSSRIRKPA
jgi:NAD(P)-dependent dehydrogenase (short-subunit alcohol dehydrogenase family)